MFYGQWSIYIYKIVVLIYFDIGQPVILQVQLMYLTSIKSKKICVSKLKTSLSSNNYKLMAVDFFSKDAFLLSV